nr:hypothetical protein [uncultured bacterium]
MNARFRVIAVCLALSSAAPAWATTYAPVSFDELVNTADVIFIGEVTDVRPYPVNTRDGTIINTRVVFRVVDPLWGTSSALEAFDFFGGEWGGVAMGVADMPVFTSGERVVMFAHRARSINPVVGFTQGLMQVGADVNGVERVWTAGGMPLTRPEAIGTQITVTPLLPMRLRDFRDRIATALEGRRR